MYFFVTSVCFKTLKKSLLVLETSTWKKSLLVEPICLNIENVKVLKKIEGHKMFLSIFKSTPFHCNYCSYLKNKASYVL